MTLPTFPVLSGGFLPKRSPLWSTQKLPASGGMESRIPLWTMPKWRYEFDLEFLLNAISAAEFDALEGLYNSVNGAAGVFGYTDPEDCTASAQTFGVGDGASVLFQLQRALGGFSEPVFLPVGTPSITVNGVATACTVTPTGTVAFTTPPATGAVLRWSGSFMWACQFDDDAIPFGKLYGGIWGAKAVKFTTVDAAKIPLPLGATGYLDESFILNISELA